MLPRILLAALLFLSVAALAIQQHDWTRMPRPEDAAAAAAFVRDAYTEGDVVRVYPWWYDDSRVGLGPLPVLPGREIDEYDRHRFTRMWLLVPDSHSEQAADATPWLRDPSEVARYGSIGVITGDIVQTDRVAWDAFTGFEDAEVSRANRDGSNEILCDTRRGTERHCQRIDPWIYVFAATREVDDTYRDCVQVNVAPAEERWIIRYNDVPRAQRLRIRSGNTLLATRSERGAPVHMRVYVDDVEVAASVTQIHAGDYPEINIEMPQAAEPARVRFEVEADDHFDRFFCFRAQTYDTSGGGAQAEESLQ